MISGRGLLGSALLAIDEQKYLFYANGISNSMLAQIPRNNFEIREVEKLAKGIENRIFIYFSTSQVNSLKNIHRRYVQHKVLLEQLIVERFPNYLIVRTSNLVGNNPWNNHTLFNYLYNSLHTNQEIIVDFMVQRNFLDVDNLVALISAYLKNYEINKTIEIVNPVSYTMQQIVKEFENYFLKKFNIKEAGAESDFALFELNTDLSKELMKICDLKFDNHIEDLLVKYYSTDKIDEKRFGHYVKPA
jgi:nucleoside-diphosphate-sugar epimerase